MSEQKIEKTKIVDVAEIEKTQVLSKSKPKNPPDTLPIGYIIHEYIIDVVLGIGAFGITYLAKDKNLNSQVAIKEYFPSYLARRSETTLKIIPKSKQNIKEYIAGVKSFLNEARTIASFKHNNLMRVSRLFQGNNTAFMVMEYELGHPLNDFIISKNRLSEGQLIDMFKPLLEGLSVVHKQGYLHRDIKPPNIYVRDADKSLVLLDFGSARESSKQLNEGLTTMLTPKFAPIEQYDSHGNQGPWSDIYAVGAVLYYCITKKQPVDATIRVIKDPLPQLKTAYAGKYSESFLESIDWMLQMAVEERPQNVHEIITIWTTGNANNKVIASKIARKSKKPLIAIVVSIILLSSVGIYQLLLSKTESHPLFTPDSTTKIKSTVGKVTWQKFFGGTNDDQLSSMDDLPDGGVIAVGWTKSNSRGGQDILVIRLDSNGHLIWKKSYGGSGDDTPDDIKYAKTEDGYYISGNTASKGKGGIDIWVMKLDLAGEMIWDHTFGGKGDDVTGDFSVIDSNTYIVTAYTQSKGAGSSDIWIFKANHQGEILWESTFGGTMSDIPDDMKLLPDGYLLMGWQDSKGAGGFDAWVLKLDSDGERVWGKTYGGNGDDFTETMQKVEKGYLLAGRTDSKGNGGFDAWLIKINQLGRMEWERTFGGPKDDSFSDIEEAPDGTFLISGMTKSEGDRHGDVWVVNVDGNGKTISIKTFGGSGLDTVSDFEPVSVYGYVFVGSSNSGGNGGSDGWIFRTEIGENRVLDGDF